MSRVPSTLVSTALIGAGALAWVAAERPLRANPEYDVPVNPLGINRSPYGEVIAMAMQGPIDTYFDNGISNGGEATADDDKSRSSPDAPATPGNAGWSLTTYLDHFITSLGNMAVERTNPKPASEALKRHLRRQAEDQLRLAYQLDPAHYGNYNSLHFFLTEPAIGTRPELTPTAAKLAADTIDYCLKQEHDPRPALTAAAAATNILHLMFSDAHNKQPKYTIAQMRQCLGLLDHCLARYHVIAQEWDQANQWELLSPQRLAECAERLRFIGKIRDAAEQTIIRLEQEQRLPQAAKRPFSVSKLEFRI